jgi:transposase InsO family protein
LKGKGEVFDKFKAYKALVENQTGMNIKTLRSDNGGEFVSKKFDDFLHECGIKRQTSAPYTP